MTGRPQANPSVERAGFPIGHSRVLGNWDGDYVDGARSASKRSASAPAGILLRNTVIGTPTSSEPATVRRAVADTKTVSAARTDCRKRQKACCRRCGDNEPFRAAKTEIPSVGHQWRERARKVSISSRL